MEGGGTRPLDPSTLAVSLGRGASEPGDPVNVPVQLSSTYRQGGDVVYGRETNPTWAAFEEVLGALEGGTAVAFASGMAAISAVVATLPPGAVVVAPADAYKGTRTLLQRLAGAGRVRVRLTDVSDTAATLEQCDGADLLWVESPTNPLIAIADIAALAAGARQRGALVAVDNTFATPILQRPLTLGADLVVHSVTKALAGHSDVLMGAVVAADDALVEAVRDERVTSGAIPGPMEAYLALRGIRTLAVRIERAQSTAGELAVRLAEHPKVDRVRYPGVLEHPGHEVAAKQMAGFGTMLSFDVAGGAPAADAVCAAVRLAVPATSLGGVETLIERRARYAGEDATPPGLLRMSVGLEHVEDLWADLAQALDAIPGAPSR